MVKIYTPRDTSLNKRGVYGAITRNDPYRGESIIILAGQGEDHELYEVFLDDFDNSLTGDLVSSEKFSGSSGGLRCLLRSGNAACKYDVSVPSESPFDHVTLGPNLPKAPIEVVVLPNTTTFSAESVHNTGDATFASHAREADVESSVKTLYEKLGLSTENTLSIDDLSSPVITNIVQKTTNLNPTEDEATTEQILPVAPSVSTVQNSSASQRTTERVPLSEASTPDISIMHTTTTTPDILDSTIDISSVHTADTGSGSDLSSLPSDFVSVNLLATTVDFSGSHLEETSLDGEEESTMLLISLPIIDPDIIGNEETEPSISSSIRPSKNLRSGMSTESSLTTKTTSPRFSVTLRTSESQTSISKSSKSIATSSTTTKPTNSADGFVKNWSMIAGGEERLNLGNLPAELLQLPGEKIVLMERVMVKVNDCDGKNDDTTEESQEEVAQRRLGDDDMGDVALKTVILSSTTTTTKSSPITTTTTSSTRVSSPGCGCTTTTSPQKTRKGNAVGTDSEWYGDEFDGIQE